MSIVLTGNDLTFDQLYAVSLRHEAVSLSAQAIARMRCTPDFKEGLASFLEKRKPIWQGEPNEPRH